MKIYLDENIPQGKSVFETFGDVHQFQGRKVTQNDLIDADILIVRSITTVNEGLLKNTPVKFVGSTTIGTDHVDINYLLSRKITFAHAPGCNSNSVGEYIISSLLYLADCKNLKLFQKKLGIIGFGNVGKNLSKKAEALGLDYLINDPPLEATGFTHEKLCSLDVIIDECDIITFHVPMNKNSTFPTYHLFNQYFINKLKRPIILINTSRGNVIEESSLLEAKKRGLISHLILDVFPGEPELNPEYGNICDILTPHIAGHSVEGKLNAVVEIFNAMDKFSKINSNIDVNFGKPEKPNIHLSNSDLSGLNQCIAHTYNIQTYSEKLRDLVLKKKSQQGFDELRNNFSKRFEFKNYKVAGANKQYKLILKNLGFEIAM